MNLIFVDTHQHDIIFRLAYIWTMKGARFKMATASTTQQQNCSAAEGGWPKTNIGYPNCDTARGADQTQLAPNLYQYCCPPAPLEMKEISGIVARPTYRGHTPRSVLPEYL